MHGHVGLEQWCQDLITSIPFQDGEEHVQIPPSSLLDSGEDSRKAPVFIIEITNSVVSYIKVPDAMNWWEPRNLALGRCMDS